MAKLKGLQGIAKAGKELKAKERARKRRDKEKYTNQEQWDELSDKSEVAGTPASRNKKTGRYAGAGAGVPSPQKKGALIRKYVQRTERALDEGLPAGYFYEQGRNTLGELSNTPKDHMTIADVFGPTSTQVGPYGNLNYAARALDQYATGAPIKTGMFPKNLTKDIEGIFAGDEPWLGHKTGRYANLLGPQDQIRQERPDIAYLPPNDQWEGLATGQGSQKVPSGAPQVAFSDHIRAEATKKINAKRKEMGEPPLTPAEVQELHWQAIRTEADGRPISLTKDDTIQGALPYFTAQHSWEAAPTPEAGIEVPDVPQWTDEIYNTVSDSDRDRFVTAMGGNYQLPMLRGTGVYKGELADGIQSRSLVSQTKSQGLDPASRARLDGTEALRQYALGQQGRAAHVYQPDAARGKSDAMRVDMGRPPSAEESLRIQNLLDERLGMSASNDPNTSIVFDDKGYRVLNTGDLTNKDFSSGVENIAQELQDLAPYTDMNRGAYSGIYGEYDWGKGGVTQSMLDVIDNPAYPKLATNADSPQTRSLMGDIASKYKQLREQGGMDNAALTRTLEAWGKGGLEAVRELVAKGLAPAIAIAILSGNEEEGPSI